MALPVFDEKSISSICGEGKRNPSHILEDIRLALDACAQDLVAVMTATGFTVKNLSSMLHGAGRHVAIGVQALAKYKHALAEIIKEGLFDARNLSSMLNGAGRYLGDGIEALVLQPNDGSPSGIEKLRAILALEVKLPDSKKIKLFDAQSLSGMLNGAGRNLATGIEALWEHKQSLVAIVSEGIFDGQNLSSMLNGGGKNLAAGIQAMMLHKSDLNSIVGEGPFNAGNLSSIFNGAGKDLGIGIAAVQPRLPELKALCTKFNPSQIATWLHSTPVKQMADAIDKLCEDLSPELSGDTVIPDASGIAAATTSGAARGAEKKER